MKQIYYPMRGLVVNNKDPFGLGRVAVRVYSFHGTSEDGVSDEDLPWAFPCFFSASYDSGTFIVPEVGNTVFVLFENGDIDRPIYIGSVYGLGKSKISYVGNTDGTLRYQRANIKEVPFDVDSLNKKVIYKSPKGSKIIIDDADGCENIKMVDPCGQLVSLYSPMTEEYSKNNAHFPKGDLNTKTFTDITGIKNKAVVLLKSLFKSFFRILSNSSGTKISLYGNGDNKALLEMVSGESSSFTIKVDNGKKFTIDISDKVKIMSDSSSVVVGDSVEITSPEVVINSNSLKLNSKDVRVVSDGFEVYSNNVGVDTPNLVILESSEGTEVSEINVDNNISSIEVEEETF